MSQIHQAKRPLFKKYFEDPLVGLVVGAICGLLWLLPLPVARKMGYGIGRIIYPFARRRNKIALKNMSVGLPDKTDAEKREIVKKMWCHFGMLFAESAHGSEILKQSRRENMELVRAAQKTGKGGFICTAHFGGWEFDVAKLVGPDFHLNPVYRKANNPWLNKILFERRPGVKIPKGTAGARLMLETLNKGDFIAILCDQKLREGMEVPFFGKPAMTATAMISLAMKKQAPIFMVKGVRGKDNIYTFSVVKQLEIPKGLDYQETLKAAMTDVNNIYWDWIKQNPEQYLWIHRRFEKSFYEE
ncbi:MAG: lysophospholipid acyltransferase family protein [Alphaproteobacteria bacterium]|nr:lysophospholipid acyltransferase family protein [Alphaproteobacteria bacterium]